jgi:gamma-glutamylcyclotransferase (GGCT)/AIG2-like uncharacterized protein YtfP
VSEYLFSYGTLLPEHAPSEISHVLAKLRPLGRATVPGVLYDLGAYPGAVLGRASGKRIAGMVFRLPNDSAILKKLDEYEGFDPANPGESLFVRGRYPVALATGRILQCWIYEYNGKRVVAPVVAGGRYCAKLSRS